MDVTDRFKNENKKIRRKIEEQRNRKQRNRGIDG